MDSQSNPELDMDQIHNLIDMAMSETYDLVSSWLPTPNSASTARDAEIATENALFEQMVFRPPGLGLGAPLPTKSSAKDEYKLRKTLSGKPALVDGSKLSEGKIGNLVDDPDISDDDSKSRIMSTKAPLHDVLALFEKGQSKKKKKRKKRPVITLDCLPNEVTAEEWNGIQFDRESTGASPIPEDLTSRFDSSGTHQVPHLLPNQSIVSDSSTLGESSRSSPTATLSPPSSLSSLRKSSNDPSLQRDGSPALLRGASLSDIPPPKKKRRKRSKVLGDTRAGVHSK